MKQYNSPKANRVGVVFLGTQRLSVGRLFSDRVAVGLTERTYARSEDLSLERIVDVAFTHVRRRYYAALAAEHLRGRGLKTLGVFAIGTAIAEVVFLVLSFFAFCGLCGQSLAASALDLVAAYLIGSFDSNKGKKISDKEYDQHRERGHLYSRCEK